MSLFRETSQLFHFKIKVQKIDKQEVLLIICSIQYEWVNDVTFLMRIKKCGKYRRVKKNKKKKFITVTSLLGIKLQ